MLDQSLGEPTADTIESNHHAKHSLTEAERRLVLFEWNDTRTEFPALCAHQLFEQQVERDPDAIAVVFNGRRLTYSELNQRANRIAHYLRRLGVGPDGLVGVCLQRSPEMVAGLLGVWKAGGAYVPLDPSYPQERLSFMIADAAVQVLLTDKNCERLFSPAHEKTVRLDSDWPTIAQESQANPDSGSTPSNLAYVMYTSGSTGTPKGAMILQSGLVNYLTWAIKTYGVKPGGSVPVHSSISFDLTVTSLYTPLLAGGRVELLAEDAAAQSLLTALKRQKGRSLVKITPAHLELLSQQLAPDEAADMTNVFVIGGENLLAEKLRLWRESAPATRLINEYGPTETVVGCCVYEVQADDPRSGSVPIGRPIDNTQLYVLDSNLQPVPVGETGELYIGGAGVARGYWNRPELTEERFLPDLFSGTPGARLYKSGDLARYRADGILEYLGRVDNQVKVRGYRIELGEIEAALASHPGVQSCAVLAREDEPGDRQLVGYVSPAKDQSPAPEELRSFLEQRLPVYMVPARIVLLESLPLTPNGKVDRKALPAPSDETIASTTTAVAPRTGTEKALAAIWAELLKVDNVGVNDSFFDLGGHSLMAFKAMSRIRDVFDVDLPVQDLFENPTIAEIAKLLGSTEDSTRTIPRIDRHAGEMHFPLSASQEQLWFLNQLAPGSPVYNVVDMIHVGTTCNSEVLRKVAKELARRHETLRTAFSYADGQPSQVVLPTVEIEISEVDLTALPEAERESEFARAIHAQTRKPFDLSQAPLIRWTIIHRTAEDHRLLVVIHHIVADEWAMGLIHKEIAQLYEDFSRGHSSSLVELPIQYADFTCWQRDRLQGDVLREQLDYWKKELAGAPPVLELAPDKPRPAVQTFRGASELFQLPLKVLEPLKSLGRQEQATLFMTLLASFTALLYRYTAQDDILVGTPISLRTQSETENLVGYFLNAVILRAQFKDNLTFRSLLQQVRERALRAYTHADLPFNQVVAEMAPERDLSRTPLFQVLFIMHDPDGISGVSSVSDIHQLENGTSKFDLTLSISETKNGLDASIEYSADLFESHTIRQIGKTFANLLEAICSNPDESVSKLKVLADAESNQLLNEWNDTVAEYPKDVPLAQLVEEQVKRTPHAIAAVFGEKRLTYADLNARANQLAHELRKHGAGPDELVGLFIERSTDLVVALLAIVKTGAAYLPLDPLFPADRLGFMLEDSGARLLITQQSLRSNVSAFAGTTIFLEDEGWRANSSEDLAVAVGPDQLAYLIYTSGSTGKPKGVQVPRGALTNFLWSMRTWLGLSECDRLLAVTTISFDIAGLEVWLPLLVGAQTVVASHAEAADGNALRGLIERHKITFLQATPVTWRLLFEAGWPGKPDLQAVCGGEAMPPEVAAKLVPAVGRVWNLYGPTETTIWSTGYKVTEARQPILIGRPLANTQCYVLDRRGQPVPVGVTGELYISGDGLARGYLNRPELTAEKFVANPFRDGDAKMYRTGDLARYRTDGNIECLGRVDHQVKLRGYRIELGEIEAVLQDLPEINQAVVIVREDTPGDKRLAAYYTVHHIGETDEVAISAEQMRSHLSASLPEYMVPAAYVRLDQMPLTPNGKLDRKALPTPGADSFSTHGFEPPQGEMETKLAVIWAEVLKLDRVGRHDNFFDLGGHSLAAVQLISKLQQLSPGDPLPLRAVLEAPTVERFAVWLQNRNGNEEQILVQVRPGSALRMPFFCVHGAGGNVLSMRPLAMALPADLPVYFLQAKGLDGSAPFESVEETAQFYVHEIRKIQPHGPYQLGGGCYGGLVAFEMARVLQQLGEPVSALIMIDSFNPAFGGTLSKLERLYRNTKYFIRRAPMHLRNMLTMPASERLHYTKGRIKAVNRYLRALGAGGAKVADEKFHEDQDWKNAQSAADTHLGEILQRVGRASRIAGMKFVPKPYKGDAMIVTASARNDTPYADDSLGWKPVVLGALENFEVEGDHVSIFKDPASQRMAEGIDAKLRQSSAEVDSVSLRA